LIYCLKMDRIDAAFGAGEVAAPPEPDEPSEDSAGGAP
jgi:hypothetical protein